jgi:putative tricarboxylic transport membrane protein
MNDILLGFSVVFQPSNLLGCFIGVIIGQVVGILPGLGPVGALSLLLPITFYIDPTTAIIMLAGIYYGAQYGGTLTSVLLNIPGEATTVVTCIDGYQMAKQGRAGPALAIAAFGSFIAGTLSTFGLFLISRPLSDFGLRFGAPEYFSLVLLGIMLSIYLASGSILKALISAFLGLWVSCIGVEVLSSTPRFNFGSATLMDGVGIVPICMGLFGISEVLINVEQAVGQTVSFMKVGKLMPNLKDWRDSIGAIFRGTGLGFFLGILPGGGAIMASFLSYTVEKRLSKQPERFGKGAIQGVAGPESANNAGAQGNFIPLLNLGIPANIVMALMLGALLIHGVRPGPFLITQNPKLFWGIITSMYVGNAMLLIMNIPLIAIWVRILKVPYYILFPLILLFCVIGAYSINTNVTDIYLMILFGGLGYIARKAGFEPAPFVLAYVLGPLLEENFLMSLTESRGNLSIFFRSSISITFLIVTFLTMIGAIFPFLRKKREIFSEE